MSGNIQNKDLKRRIIDISFRHKLSHIGSCMSAIDLIDALYRKKKRGDRVYLSAGHAGLALYCALEKHEKRDAEYLMTTHGVHPNRDVENGIHISAGSLGQACTVAVGCAIAMPKSHHHVVCSDGEVAEGSFWETLEYCFENEVKNITFYIISNGYGAYRQIDYRRLLARIIPYTNALQDDSLVDIIATNSSYISFLKGQEAHYLSMDENQYQLAMDLLK